MPRHRRKHTAIAKAAAAATVSDPRKALVEYEQDIVLQVHSDEVDNLCNMRVLRRTGAGYRSPYTYTFCIKWLKPNTDELMRVIQNNPQANAAGACESGFQRGPLEKSGRRSISTRPGINGLTRRRVIRKLFESCGYQSENRHQRQLSMSLDPQRWQPLRNYQSLCLGLHRCRGPTWGTQAATVAISRNQDVRMLEHPAPAAAAAPRFRTLQRQLSKVPTWLQPGKPV
jgi:hypothetical protein